MQTFMGHYLLTAPIDKEDLPLRPCSRLHAPEGPLSVIAFKAIHHCGSQAPFTVGLHRLLGRRGIALRGSYPVGVVSLLSGLPDDFPF